MVFCCFGLLLLFLLVVLLLLLLFYKLNSGGCASWGGKERNRRGSMLGTNIHAWYLPPSVCPPHSQAMGAIGDMVFSINPSMPIIPDETSKIKSSWFMS